MSKKEKTPKDPNKPSFSDRLARFMYGRNGADQLNLVLLVLSCILLIVASFLQNTYLSMAAILLIFLYLFRAFSKNLAQRQKENAYVVKAQIAIQNWWKLNRKKYQDRKTHVYKKCSKCKRILRTKKRKGTKVVDCPYCGTPVIFKIRTRGAEEKAELKEEKLQQKAEKARAKEAEAQK